MKRVDLSEEQCQVLEDQGNMITFNMALPPDIIKGQIIEFLHSRFVDESKVDEMADQLLSDLLAHTLDNTQ